MPSVTKRNAKATATAARQNHAAVQELLDILRELVSWADYMGGWGDPVWRRAEKAIKKYA